MPNVQNNPPANPGLIAPGQLWSPKPQPVVPAQAPGTPAPSTPAPGTPSGLNSPDQLRQLMNNKMPPIGQIPGQVPLVGPAPSDLKGQLGQLQNLMKTADQQTLAPYGVVVQSNAQGQVTGYLLNGQPATAQQVQQHLLPLSTRLHKELLQTKATVDQEFNQFIQRTQSQFAQMNPVEQNAVKIQLQAVQSIYQEFLNRLSQVDNLIK
ncbi:hypothetical protein COW36_19960 [bacterium (Candidatus Blackallbacteria) CG17_big_fil_post_rev_8_21_14_2_50_48_46]|uniref:Uncharacterized protein n=1 Tax=bacterium (Candidatus Blackallbacteria) CG17_big_fil_post_rev_8_21_14_2_50_48_46 TaxID=2014261 RepID=A0A2M7FZU5_9BACT|nr:MAG: hypothetical protein COW64_15335 [bacterium (Candidatus Blackallbacteria) CG18_big_fil_WC_8_21_14_2_50_49_26]PIW14924.1 MAG: hypothetical protein COW36_19960 [bacterium (Candidatus Blackallbacteria) CG17_big_fil_post_rev_8_21_14_2_50_48_46]PIW44288.1 MAG: hypothetical protein COW20_24400 [bacterium (Candidatus Blackallbacteria) CG13_big_fil_rev_8_21_14_2_50_49_14]